MADTRPEPVPGIRTDHPGHGSKDHPGHAEDPGNLQHAPVLLAGGQ